MGTSFAENRQRATFGYFEYNIAEHGRAIRLLDRILYILKMGVDFRSFRTMHASLMRRLGGRLEVARDNMGHAGSTGPITLDVYSKTWWEERVDAVTRVVEAVFTEPEEKPEEQVATPPKPLRKGERDENWVPSWEPQGGTPGQISV